MSSTGGGLHTVLAHDQIVWTDGNLEYALTLRNETDTNTTVTSEQCAAMVENLDPGDYMTTWDGSTWSTPS